MGEEIKKARSEASLTQREAAQKIGISHSYLSQIESGREVNVSLENIYKIGYVLDISFAYLLYLSDINTNHKPKYDERILPIIKESDYISFSTFPDLKKIFPEEFKKLPHELLQEVFFFLDEAKGIKESILFELSRNTKFLNDAVEFEQPNFTPEALNSLEKSANAGKKIKELKHFEIANLLSLSQSVNFKGIILTDNDKQLILDILEGLQRQFVNYKQK